MIEYQLGKDEYFHFPKAWIYAEAQKMMSLNKEG